MPRPRGMALGGGGHVFQPIVDEFYRAAGFHGQDRGMSGDHGRVLLLAAESPARFHLHHADFFFRQPAQFHQCLVDVVGTLQGTPDRNAGRGVEDGDHAVVLYVQVLLCRGGILAFDDEMGLVPDTVHVAFFDQESLEDIVLAPDDVEFSFRFPRSYKSPAAGKTRTVTPSTARANTCLSG